MDLAAGPVRVIAEGIRVWKLAHACWSPRWSCRQTPRRALSAIRPRVADSLPGSPSRCSAKCLWAMDAIATTPTSAYSAAQAGRHALTKNLALELAGEHPREPRDRHLGTLPYPWT